MIQWKWVAEIAILAAEALVRRDSPEEVLTAVTVFSVIMGYAKFQSASREQMITLCAWQSVVLLVWVLCSVILHVLRAT